MTEKKHAEYYPRFYDVIQDHISAVIVIFPKNDDKKAENERNWLERKYIYIYITHSLNMH